MPDYELMPLIDCLDPPEFIASRAPWREFPRLNLPDMDILVLPLLRGDNTGMPGCLPGDTARIYAWSCIYWDDSDMPDFWPGKLLMPTKDPLVRWALATALSVLLFLPMVWLILPYVWLRMKLPFLFAEAALYFALTSSTLASFSFSLLIYRDICSLACS